jgi:glycosyltransferase involved in cell wall biosynthesis
MPSVSVVLTSFNHGRYIREAIESVLNQTFQDFELIIWDDASVDDSWEIIRSYNDSRLRAYRSPENKGAVFAVNQAIFECAQGKYIAIHHSDAVWEPDKLEKQVIFLDTNADVGAVFTNAQPIDQRGAPLADESHFYYSIFNQPNRSRHEWLRFFFLNSNALCHPSILIRKQCYDVCGPYLDTLAQLPDFDMWVRLCAKYEIHVMADRLIKFRTLDGGMNAGGIGPVTRIRHFNELNEVLQRYRHLAEQNEIFKIFPDSISYDRGEDTDPEYVLARVCLESAPHFIRHLLAIEVLFDILKNPVRRQALETIYGFSSHDFIAITGQYDPFSREELLNLQTIAAERDGQIARLNQAVTQRDGQIASVNQVVTAQRRQIANIYCSNSWHLTRPLRALRQLPVWLRGRALRRFTHNAYTAVRGEIRRRGLAGFVSSVPYYLRNYRIYIALLASRAPAADGGLFNAMAPAQRDIRLHPELAGIGDPIDASVSVVIPTLNAGLEFHWLLRKLRTQRGLREIEIVIVDSGSSDGTIERARDAGCTVVEIPLADFSHSYSRNTGADAAHGDYLLFMVQDAYPIGDYWIYGILRYLLDHSDEKLVAASCSEYSRSDSDMMYDSMINTHYRFLGCLDYDRIGEYHGDDHMSLRAYGQLSDVSCLIPRETFACYRYRGDYAEDLDLGIRLIKNGFRIAMLASVKVVHSHNRPAYYYLKRSFVDVIFLVRLFDDFVYPHVVSERGLIAGIVSVGARLSDWLSGFDGAGSERVLHQDVSEWIRAWRSSFVELHLGKHSRLGDTRLDAYIDSLADRYLSSISEELDKDARYEMRRFLDAFLARIEHFNTFAAGVYGSQDAFLRRGLRDAVLKIFGATAGSALGFMYLDLARSEGVERKMAETISNELRAGI